MSSNILMKELDAAASSLLKRHFPTEESAEQPDPVDQIKAFAAVVNYYGPRTKLGGKDEENKGNGIDGLRARLHGSGKVGGRPRRGPPQSGQNGAASADDTPAGSA